MNRDRNIQRIMGHDEFSAPRWYPCSEAEIGKTYTFEYKTRDASVRFIGVPVEEREGVCGFRLDLAHYVDSAREIAYRWTDDLPPTSAPG